MRNGKIRFDELVKEALDSFEDYFQEVTADVKKDVLKDGLQQAQM